MRPTNRRGSQGITACCVLAAAATLVEYEAVKAVRMAARKAIRAGKEVAQAAKRQRQQRSGRGTGRNAQRPGRGRDAGKSGRDRGFLEGTDGSNGPDPHRLGWLLSVGRVLVEGGGRGK